MRVLIISCGLFAAPAIAQVPPAEIGTRNVPAPWWMRDPVIASLGKVELKLPANRARMDVSFSVVDGAVDDAMAAASRKVMGIDGALRNFSAERVRSTTTFVTRPLYEQYRDKGGNILANARADKIDRYEVSAEVQIEVNDVAALEEVYNTVVAARPSRIGAIGWTLEPGNEVLTNLAIAAARDAQKRAQASANAVGARLGAVKVIDPSGGICATEVLAGWPAYTDGDGASRISASDGFAGSADAAAVAMGSAGPASTVTQRVTLTPPLLPLSDTACVVYAIN
jgi:uncharacterized protein